MPPALRLALRAAWYITVGALTLGALGFAMYLPSEFGATPRASSGASIGLGVTLACARLGAVIGFIVFLLKRALTGEVADPRDAPPVRRQPAPR